MRSRCGGPRLRRVLEAGDPAAGRPAPGCSPSPDSPAERRMSCSGASTRNGSPGRSRGSRTMRVPSPTTWRPAPSHRLLHASPGPAPHAARRYRAVTLDQLVRDVVVFVSASLHRDHSVASHSTLKEGTQPMPFSYRRALGITVAAVATSTAALAAQAPAPPQVTVGGLVYTQYVYQLKDSVNHFNNFDITRAYLNVLGRFAGGVTARLTVDVQRFGTIATTPPTTDNSLRLRLKYAFATYTPPGSPVTFKAGLIHTPWLDWEEAVWDYRMQGTMATDRAGYLSAADYGVGVDGKWMADKVNFQFTVVNGTFYSGTSAGAGKDAQARVSVRVLDTNDSSRVGGLRIAGYAGYGRALAGDRNRFIGMISYRSKEITLAGEAAVTQDGVLSATNGHVYSAFGVYKFPQTKAAVIARVDVLHRQAGAVDKQTRFIGGVSYQLSPNWRLLADWDYADYQTDALNAANFATRSQALFQTQINFYLGRGNPYDEIAPDRPGRRPDARRPRGRPGEAERRRCDASQHHLSRLDADVQQDAPGRAAQLPVDRLGRRDPSVLGRHRGLRRDRRADEGLEHHRDQRQRAPHPDRARGRRADVQPARGQGDAPLHPRRARRHLPREDHEVERRAHHVGQPRGQAPRRGHRGGAPLRRLRHELHLDRLPVEGELRMGAEGRSRNVGQLPRRTRR